MNVSHYASRPVVSIGPFNTIDKAISLMEEFNIRHLPVVKDREVVGIVSDRDILLSVGWKLEARRHRTVGDDDRIYGPQRIEQIMSAPPVTVKPKDTAAHAVHLMIERKLNALPVINRGNLTALLSSADLLRHAQQTARNDQRVRALLDRQVHEFMRTRLATVQPRTTVIEIVNLLRKRHIRHVPVTVDGVVVGIISDRDVRRSLAESSLNGNGADAAENAPAEVPCAMDIMTRHVHTVTPEATLLRSASLMLDHHIHGLPVVEAGRLVGMITHTDLLRTLAAADAI